MFRIKILKLALKTGPSKKDDATHHKHYQLTLLWLYNTWFQNCLIYLTYHYIHCAAISVADILNPLLNLLHNNFPVNTGK